MHESPFNYGNQTDILDMQGFLVKLIKDPCIVRVDNFPKYFIGFE